MPASKGKFRASSSNVPRYLRRWLTMYFWSIGVLSVLGALVPVMLVGKIRPWLFGIFCALPGLSIGLAGSMLGLLAARAAKRAIAMQGRVCWDCGYHLYGLEDKGKCPECGHAYDVSDLLRRWNQVGELPEGVLVSPLASDGVEQARPQTQPSAASAKDNAEAVRLPR